MTCGLIQPQLHAYADGMLAVDEVRQVNAHLERCGECQLQLQELQSLLNALGDKSLRHTPSPLFQIRLQRALQDSASTSWFKQPATPTSILLGILGIVAVIGVLFLAGSWLFSRQLLSMQELIVNNDHSSMARNAEIQSTDATAISRWLRDTAQISVPVMDFAAQGYAIVGAQLTQVDHLRIPVLHYRSKNGSVRLYLYQQHCESMDSNNVAQLKGINVLTWRHNDVVYWALTNQTPAMLLEFKGLLQRATP